MTRTIIVAPTFHACMVEAESRGLRRQDVVWADSDHRVRGYDLKRIPVLWVGPRKELSAEMATELFVAAQPRLPDRAQ